MATAALHERRVIGSPGRSSASDSPPYCPRSSTPSRSSARAGCRSCASQRRLGNNWVRAVAADHDRRARPRHRGRDTGRDHHPGGRGHARARVRRARRAIDGKGSVSAEKTLPIHRAPPAFEDQTTSRDVRGPQDRHHLPVQEGRQDPDLRRRRRPRKTVIIRSDQQRRDQTLRRVGVRGRGRAISRGNDLIHEMTESGASSEHGVRVRPDQRPRRAPAVG